MAKLTDKELYEFVYRADTAQKICVAERWLRQHQHLTSRSTFDDLISVLNRTAKKLFRARMEEYEKKIYGENYEINVITGELLTCSEGIQV